MAASRLLRSRRVSGGALLRRPAWNRAMAAYTAGGQVPAAARFRIAMMLLCPNSLPEQQHLDDQSILK